MTLGFWLFLIPALTIYTFATLWGVPKVGRWFFRQFCHDEGAEFTFVVATLFVVSYLAKLPLFCHFPGIMNKGIER